ncbi:MAG: hypothetical protein J6Z45_00905 [Oscillospiraceae bacterium]|nr:hypothetical protein [Oscillospiraceae bacterium]
MNEITTRILKALLLVFAVVLVFSIVYHLLFQGYRTETAIYYEVSDASVFQGVYIRDESVERFSGRGAVRYCVSDGAKLGVGSVIAEIYENEEQIDLRRRIAEKQAELQRLTKIENPGTSENAQPNHLASLIGEQYRTLVQLRERGDYDALRGCRQEMSVLMSTYEKITDPALDLSERIRNLKDDIAILQSQQTEPLNTVRASRSAYFVSFIDGYEDTLTMEGVRRLTPEQLAAVSDEGSGAQEGDVGAIGKLIDGYAWYIAGVFDNTKLRLSEGDTASVRLESLGRKLTVTVESLISAGDVTRTQGVFRCEQLTQEVVQHRTERVEILRKTVEGIKVPRSAIRFKEIEETIKNEDGTTYTQKTNYKGVYVRIGETAEFRKLDIVYEDENFYLSSLNAGNGYVALYDDIIVKGVTADGS